MNAVLDEYGLLSAIRARRSGAALFASARELEKRVCPVVKDQGKAMKVGIFAGVHGDEPSGVKAAHMLHRWALTLPKELSGYEIHLFPCCNPSGLNDGTRHTGMGYDINREFWCGSDLPEVRYLESELRSERYDVIVSLHEDDTSHGLYGFVSGSLLSEQVLKPALIAASRYLPLNLDERIDGFSASGGVIIEGYPGVLSAPPEQRPRALEIVFETPGSASVKLQAVAAAVAVKTMLVEYRKFLAYADNL
ncbi:MAG: succinylglutamate desuccinylase/aspartoacylase family protein [Verrucomicrobia bacterium]|nr:succinylglutamate desuccinylase/aspartoacylase family protein [Verrucomicrobiota bacterium]